MRNNVLLIEDDATVRTMIRTCVEEAGFAVREAEDVATGLRAIETGLPDVVMLDHLLPDGDGLSLLAELQVLAPAIPVVVMTGYATVQRAVTAMERGAFTYLEKPFDHETLLDVLAQAAATSQARRTGGVGPSTRLTDVVAESRCMKRVLSRVRTVAATPASSVLLLGESGTGKGLLARAIHAASARAKHPFLTVTCSAIPDHLLESELFGHERGAFTDAKTRRPGVFEAAQGGTVFLDEVGDMPLTLQSKLLGVLEERTIRRVGGTEDLDIDVRIVAATHRDLDQLAADGTFRHDLLYRLRVVPIVIPPLRDRKEDVLPLARGFVEEFNERFRKRVTAIDARAQRRLDEHDWPGNVRELRNVMERAMIFAAGTTIRSSQLEFGGSPARAPAAADVPPVKLPENGISLEEVERSLVLQALERAGGVKSRAARILGISRDQVRYRLEKMGWSSEGPPPPAPPA